MRTKEEYRRKYHEALAQIEYLEAKLHGAEQALYRLREEFIQVSANCRDLIAERDEARRNGQDNTIPARARTPKGASTASPDEGS